MGTRRKPATETELVPELPGSSPSVTPAGDPAKAKRSKKRKAGPSVPMVEQTATLGDPKADIGGAPEHVEPNKEPQGVPGPPVLGSHNPGLKVTASEVAEVPATLPHQPSHARTAVSSALLCLAHLSAVMSLLGNFAQFMTVTATLALSSIPMAALLVLVCFSRLERAVAAFAFPSLSPPQDRKVLRFALVSLAATTCLSGYVGHLIRSSQPPTASRWSEPPSLDISYARFFGFYQSLFTLSSVAKTRREKGLDTHINFFFDVGEAEDNWRAGPFADYEVARDPILALLPQPHSEGWGGDPRKPPYVDIVFGDDAVEAKKKLDRYDKIRSRYVEDTPEPLGKELDSIAKWVEPYNQRIGVLVLSLAWQGDYRKVDDVRILFKFVSISPLRKRMPKNLFEAEVASASERELVLPNPRLAGPQLLFPVSVYRADKDGYEEEYIACAAIPTKILYREDGVQKQVSVRAPLRDKAAKVTLPFGWWGQ